MTALFPPTDSILRRHFDQIAASAGLPPLPEDSVLRRHHAQLLESRLSARRAPVAQQAPVREAQAKMPEPATQRVAQPSLRPIPASPAEPVQAKGWFGRVLDKLFS